MCKVKMNQLLNLLSEVDINKKEEMKILILELKFNLSNWKWIENLNLTWDKLNKLDLESNWFGLNWNVKWRCNCGSLCNELYP